MDIVLNVSYFQTIWLINTIVNLQVITIFMYKLKYNI